MMKEFYGKEITDASLRELETFAKWLNEKKGNHPIIVGGWASYAYVGGFGSKDIDVVFPSAASKDTALAEYMHSHGYREKRRSPFAFQKEFYKEEMVRGKPIEIIIDATSTDRIIEVTGTKARIPWAWAGKYMVGHKFGNSEAYIPEIELLLTYKIGAVVGRASKLSTAVDEDAMYYQSKLWKDVYDVLTLFGKDANIEKLAAFLVSCGLGVHFAREAQSIINRFREDSDIAPHYKSYEEKLSGLIPLL